MSFIGCSAAARSAHRVTTPDERRRETRGDEQEPATRLSGHHTALLDRQLFGATIPIEAPIWWPGARSNAGSHTNAESGTLPIEPASAFSPWRDGSPRNDYSSDSRKPTQFRGYCRPVPCSLCRLRRSWRSLSAETMMALALAYSGTARMVDEAPSRAKAEN